MTAMLLAFAMTAQAKFEPDRVGRIVIEGNTATPDRVILGLLDFGPGQRLLYPQLDAARKLLGCGLFDRANPPTVEVIPNEFDSRFKDIRIRVTERPDAWAYYAAIDTVWGVVTLDVEELMDVGKRVRSKLNGKE
jgi:Surface antigen variable number repeat